MITQDEAIQMARDAGVDVYGMSDQYFEFTEQELTAFANAVRRKTLLEAAEVGWWDKDIAYELKRMAEGE